MYTLTSLGLAPSSGSCSGWESDPESFSKRVAEHYVRTVLGQSLSARRIVPYYPSGNKKYMEVQFAPGLEVGVSFVKIPDYVIALRLRAHPPGPPRYYIYSCTPDGNLVLKERPAPAAAPQTPTSLRMRANFGGWGGFGQAPSGQNQISREAREQHARELRGAIRNNRVVQAIRRLPEGQVCPAPERMATFEQRIREKLRGSFLWDELETGINLWRQSEGFPPHPSRRQLAPMNTGPSMREATEGDVRRSAIYTARVLEEKFLLAERTGDQEGMVKAAEDYHKLLGSYPPQGSGDPMPGRGTMQRQRERELEARESIMRQAPNLASIVNTLASRGLPITRRIMVEHLRQRVLLRQQRSRVRR